MRIFSFTGKPDTVAKTAIVLNDPPPPGKMYALPVPLGLTSLQFGGKSTESFRQFLAELIKEWLRCGKKIMPAGSIVRAHGMGPAGGYAGDIEWAQYLAPDRFSPNRRETLEAIDESDPALDSWLWKVYWDYLHRFKPTEWFNSFGEVFFWYLTPIQKELDPPTALPPFLNAENGNDPAWLEALLWFILLLNSGHAHLLEQCQHCRRFFVRKRGKKTGQAYKRGGPSCRSCKGVDSKERTRAQRETAKARMIDIAARAWASWKRTNRTPDRHAATAARVNAECPEEIGVTTRRDRIEPLWVRRNEKEILERVEAARDRIAKN
jgi:hypothetical protein